jgi:hypothetical protein
VASRMRGGVGLLHSPTHPPIITMDVFHQARQVGTWRQGLRTAPGLNANPNSLGRTYLLRGFVFRAGCGYRMCGQTVKQYTYFPCQPRKYKDRCPGSGHFIFSVTNREPAQGELLPVAPKLIAATAQTIDEQDLLRHPVSWRRRFRGGMWLRVVRTARRFPISVTVGQAARELVTAACRVTLTVVFRNDEDESSDVVGKTDTYPPTTSAGFHCGKFCTDQELTRWRLNPYDGSLHGWRIGPSGIRRRQRAGRRIVVAVYQLPVSSLPARLDACRAGMTTVRGACGCPRPALRGIAAISKSSTATICRPTSPRPGIHDRIPRPARKTAGRSRP